MTQSKTQLLQLAGFALIGLVPAALAARFAPGLWTFLAAAGTTIAMTGLVSNGWHRARSLARLETRERALQAATATAESRAEMVEARMREVATLDDVSGVLNRRTFLERLDRALERNRRPAKPLAFLLIDIAGFRRINAEAGRMVGDRVLRAVGKAIQSSTRGTDFVGRVGGDEFAVFLPECHDPRPAIDRLFVSLHGESTGEKNAMPIQVGVGVVTIGEQHKSVDPVRLFSLAEDALASARDGGRCGTREYTAEAPRLTGASLTASHRLSS